MELHPDQRIATEEGRHRAWSKDVGKLRRATHAQAAANFIAGAGDDRLRGIESAGGDLALGEDIAARGRSAPTANGKPGPTVPSGSGTQKW
jgi:hypothetical protein